MRQYTILNHDKDGNKKHDGDICYPVAPVSSSLDPLSPLFNGMTPNIHDEKAGSNKTNLRSHPYARSSSKKQQKKKQNRQAKNPQSYYSDTSGLDTDDGCFGDHFINQ